MWVLMYDYMLFNSAILVLQNWCAFVSNFGLKLSALIITLTLFYCYSVI